MAKGILNIYFKDEYITNSFKYYSARKDMNKMIKIISKEVGKKIEASIHFISSKTIKNLNKEHRDLNMTTDVLSFPHNEMEDKILYIGDIFINIDIIDSQSKEIGSDPLTEVKFLTMHGLLHLIGYDHLEFEDEKIMCKRQRKIFTKLKIRNDLKESDLV